MSRKKDILEEERANVAAADGVYDDEETVDISRFTAQPKRRKAAESEEARKVAELMESILSEEAESSKSALKPKKERKAEKAAKKRENKKSARSKKGKKFGFERDSDFAYNDGAQQEPIYGEADDSENFDYDGAAADDSSDELYDDTYSYDYDTQNGGYEDIEYPPDYENDYERAGAAAEKKAIEEPEKYIEEPEEYTEEPEEYAEEPEEYAEEPEEYIEEPDDSAEQPTEQPDDLDNNYEQHQETSKGGFWQKIKAFWTGSEDFEEKFDESFDPSVFDENNRKKAAQESKPEREYEEESDEENTDGIEPENDGEDEDTEPAAEADEEIADEQEDESPDKADDTEQETGEEEYAEPENEYHDEVSEARAKKEGSIFGRIKKFWNGDDIKSRAEQVTEEEIEAEERADGGEWIKSNVKYDDLSDYAPKERTQQTDGGETAEEADEYEDEAPRGGKGVKGLFAAMSGKLKAVFNPSLSENAEDGGDDDIDDETYDDGETDEAEDETAVKKSSPIEQIKSIWNDDDSYDDEDEYSDEDDIPIDAEFEDEEIKPQKPVLTVIDPSRGISDEDEQPEPEDNDDYDGEEDGGEVSETVEEEEAAEDSSDRAEAVTEAPTEQTEEEKLSAEEAEDEIISEGPDVPIEVTRRAPTKKRGFMSRLKGFWNGESFRGGSDDGEDGEETENAETAEQEKTTAPQEEIKAENEPQDEDVKPEQPEEQDGGAEKAAEPEADKTEAAAAAVEPRQEENTATFEEISSGAVKIDEVDGRQLVNGRVIPKYVHESAVEKISLINDDLQSAVRREYEEYIKQAKYKPKASEIVAPEVNSEVSKAVKEGIPAAGHEPRQEEAEQEKKPKKGEKRSLKDVLFGEVENSADFSEFKEQTNINQQGGQQIDDYEKPSDARAIRAEINYDNRKVAFRCVALGAVFLIALVMYIIQRYAPSVLTDNIPNSDLMTCLISLILLLVSAVMCHSTVFGGLKPLLAFKGNSDTAVAVATVGCAAQGIISFFEPHAFFNGGLHLYSILAIAALLLNNLGKLCIVRRIRDNFRFVSSPNRKYAARIFGDEDLSKQMISKTNADKPVVALQRRTRFLKGFLRFSYMPDPSERAASFMAPITTVIAVLVAVICGISVGSVSAALSAFSLVACMGVPMCCLLAVNIPIKKLCSDALANRAMVIGYPAVKQFADTRAVMVDSRELYPRGSVQLLAVKTFNAYNIDKALLNAAAVMKIANTPMTYMFEDVISEKGEQLPEVESVKYEDGKGIVSWVDGERLLLGNRELMTKYSINLPSADFEESSMKSRTNSITYLANAGQLVAMLVTDYQADRKLAEELKRLENNGVTILIRTADPNVSQLKVAKDFRIFIRSIKILPTTLGNVCKDEMSHRDESARALISTEGRLHSLARAIGGCIKIRDNISIAIIIQIIAVALGVLIAGVVSLFAGLSGLSGLDLLLYVVFWAAASIIAPLIQRA